MVPLHVPERHSALAAARLQRRLTLTEAARRAGISEDEAEWLEDGRVYRFRTVDAALLAHLLYATALGIDHREAQTLAGLRLNVVTRTFEPGIRARFTAVAAIAGLLAALVTAIGFSKLGDAATTKAALAAPGGAALLPAPWQIHVDVFDGTRNIVRARTLASRIGGYGYAIERVRKATRSDYPRTMVYYEPGGQAIAVRLARTLNVATAPLPGGRDAHRLVVIVGRR